MVQPQDEVAAQNNILVGGEDTSKPGYSLYVFDNDLGQSGSTCTGACQQNWPPLLLVDDAPSGVSQLNTITRSDGSKQVTYDGRPLYFYIGDDNPGDTNGNSGPWHIVELGLVGILLPYLIVPPNLPLSLHLCEKTALLLLV